MHHKYFCAKSDLVFAHTVCATHERSTYELTIARTTRYTCIAMTARVRKFVTP